MEGIGAVAMAGACSRFLACMSPLVPICGLGGSPAAARASPLGSLLGLSGRAPKLAMGVMPRPPMRSKAPALPRPLVLAGARHSRFWPGALYPSLWLVLSGPSVASLRRSSVFKLSFSGRFAGSALLALQCRLPLLCRFLLSSFSYFDFLYYSLYMTESLLAKLGDLNFTAEEQDAVVVVPESVAIPVEDFACSLVGRVLSSGPLDGGRVARLFRTIWKDDKHADPACTIHHYAFRYMCIWVRIHNIPLSLMTEALARTLCACIGKVVMTVTQLEDGNMGEFLCVRVSLDTTKPLRRFVTLSRSNAKAILCPLQYERIPIFCHGCGLIRHTVLQCPTTPQVEDQKLQYGAWLRAPFLNECLLPAPVALRCPPPAASDAAALVPVSTRVGSASSDAPVTAGRTAAISAPLSAPLPHGEVLVNRMKSVLPNCISSTQAAFVQGRAITDNILVAHELVHTLPTLVSRSSQGAIFKLDMEKAFDRVEWPFLNAIMLRLGFTQPWVDLIMRCVSSVSSRVRLRGTLSEAFLPRRGLRQGDPFSPFLFLFYTEGLSATLTVVQREGRLPGVRAYKHGPPLNHPLFADDSLVFLRNDLSEVHYLKDILSTYSAVSGQKVNFSKSTAYFSPRTPPEYRVAVHEALGVQEVSDPGIYLGVPLLIGKNKYAAFGRYRDKMDTRVSKWSNLLLSFSGHEVLIKSIAQALPQYADLCQPKVAGGMGFKDLHLFNIALLGKQLWRLLSEPGSLLYRTFRPKYFPDGDLLHASVPARSSFAWKGLHCALSRLRDGFFWTLGVDRQVRMFRDRWGGFSPVAITDSSVDDEELPIRCRDFMVLGQPLWDRSKLSACLSSADVKKIVEVPISSGRVDTLIWGDHDSGLYIVRSSYLFLRRPSSPFAPPPHLWKILAKLPAVPKVRSFGWRCGRDALPAGSHLRDAGLSDGACPLCGARLEDTLHALRDCPDSSLALRQADFCSPLLSSGHASAVGWLDFATSILSQRYSKQDSNGFEHGHRGEGFIIVYTMNLSKTFSD
ncbi:hypothetical protein GQ457_03G017750 [Hibiscus cannabinus]